MKKLLKKGYAGILLSFAASFMIFIYEQVLLYSSNKSDYWFDIYMYFPIVFWEFVISFILISAILLILLKFKSKIYKKFYVFCFALFLALYIEGNYLVGFLPWLNKERIIWGDYVLPMVISSVVWILVFVLTIVALKKLKYKKFQKYTSYIVIAIVLMLSVSLGTTMVSKKAFVDKEPLTATTKDITDISKSRNFVILIIDAADSRTFAKELKRLDKEYIFEDFTYFPDTLAGYPFTKLSVPHIMTGERYDNSRGYQDFYADAIEKSELLKAAEDHNYKIYLYENKIAFRGTNYLRTENIKPAGNIRIKRLLKEQGKITLFRYLPFVLKRFSQINTYNIATTRSVGAYGSSNIRNYNTLHDNEINLVDYDRFVFQHLEGAHTPFNHDYEFNVYPNGDATYEDKIDASIRVTELYLQRYRDTGNFDNTAFVILADHGYGNGYKGRQNPILYIKGFNEKHPFKTSDKKVSFDDLTEAFVSLMNGKKSSDLFKNVKEETIYYFYKYTKDCLIIEQKTTGHAWETDKLIDTGVRFDKCK